MTEIEYWLWLTLKKEIDSRKITLLLARFATPKEIFYAKREDFLNLPGLREEAISALCDKNLAAAKAVIETCRKKGIRILAFDSPYYPQLLARIYDPPYVLYAKYTERIDLNQHLTLAMVGTRRATSFGKSLAGDMATCLAKEGVTIVSGMAAGIDGASHKGALSGGGKTVAVLGSGVDVCYPAFHKGLMQKIIENGMVLSEYPPGTRPFPQNFPERNRIVSGLSYGTLVIESPEEGGSLITAHRAEEQNRDLFSIPADVTRDTFKGSNMLLQEGAKAVLSPKDILEEYEILYRDLLKKNKPVLEKQMKTNSKKQGKKKPEMEKPTENADFTEQELKVLSMFSGEPVHVEALTECGLSAAELSGTLTMLELKGAIKALPGKQFIKTSF